MSKRVVVIGGSAAGMTAASVAKRRDPDLVVTVFEQGGAISYSACSMPYRLGGQIETPMEDLVVVTPEEARSGKGLDVRMRTRVTRVDADRKQVHWEDLEDKETGTQEYDELVLAVGARAREAVPVVPECGVFALRSLDDGVALEAWLKRYEPKKAVIVGAGFIGVEVAEAFLQRGMEVTLANRSRHVLGSMLDEGMAETVARRLEESGVRFLTMRRATGWEGRDGVVHQVERVQVEGSPEGAEERGTDSGVEKAVKKTAESSEEGAQGRVKSVLLEGEPVEADVVVVAAGVRPDSFLAQQVGCEVRQDGSVVVDRRMRTSVEGVWACGDCVAFPHRLHDDPVFLPLALHANRSGRIVGANLTGGAADFPGVLGTAITRFLDLEVASTGITKKMAGRLGLDVVVADVDSMTQAGYMPGEHKVRVRVVAQLSTGRLLGVQMVGAAGTALRIDAAAAMIWKGATLEEVESMDLAYNPPFSPVWDPLLIAARVTEKKRVPAEL